MTSVSIAARRLLRCPHRPRTPLVAACLTLTLAGGLAAAVRAPVAVSQEVSEDDARRARLAESLIHDGERSRLLNLAEAELQAGRIDNGVESLRRVLAADHDAFSHDTSRQSLSLRTRALHLLQTASPAVHAAWRTAVEPAAAAALQRAIDERRRIDIRRVARFFPLTDSGFAAHLLCISQLVLTADSAEAELEIDEFKATYFNTRFSGRAADAVRRWSALMLSRSTSIRSPDARLLKQPVSLRRRDASLSRPWPLPEWSWNESAADAEPRVQRAIGEFRAGITGSGPANVHFSNWCTLDWGDVVVHRSPLRIIAFHPEDGRVAWQIPTDTLPPEDTTSDTRQPVTPLPAPSRFDACGVMAADDDLLYFVDGYNLLPEQSPLGRRSYGAFHSHRMNTLPDTLGSDLPEHRNSVLGRRLVAVTRDDTGQPRIAWIVGSLPSQPYSLMSDGELRPGARRHLPPGTVETDTAGTVLVGHSFYSAPVGRFRHIYVLTVAFDQVWLNCLQKADGSVVWQQPICMMPDSLDGIASGIATVAPLASCVQTPDALICCIPDGPIVSVAATSGQLNWAATVEDRSHFRRQRRFAFNVPDQLPHGDFLPVVSGDRLVWSSAASSDVYCLDVQTGQTLWRTSRTASGPGSISSSDDRYSPGIIDHQVILLGPHHCRSLDLASGEQLWSTELTEQTGRAVIDRDVCLIPEHRGTLSRVDLSNGNIDRVSTQFLPEGAQTADGAVSIDHRYVYVATPVSMIQFARADLVTEPRAGFRRIPDPVDRALAARLANGRESALAILTQFAFSESSSPDTQRLHELAAELVLQDIAPRVFGETGPTDRIREIRDEPQWQLLSRLQLTSEQQIRAKLIDYGLRAYAENLRPAASSGQLLSASEWSVLHSIDGDWAVRPDVLLLEQLRRTGHPDTAAQWFALDDAARADSVLFARSAAADEALAGRIRRLADRGSLAAAEALAAVAVRRAESADAADEFGQILNDLRRPVPGSPYESLPADDPAGQQRSAFSYVIQEHRLERHAPSVYASIINGRLLGESARHPSIMVYLSEDEHGRSVSTVDSRTGSLLSSLQPGFRPEFADAVPLPQEDCGLIILQGDTHLAAVYLRPHGQLQLLWKRRVGRFADEVSVQRVGAIGPDYLLWQSESRLHCTHPLTGRDLWSRNVTFTDPGGLIMGFPMLFGDHEVTVVVDADQRSCQKFSTRDGRFLGTAAIDFDRTQTVLAVGRRLIGVRTGSLKLSIQDFADQSELLDQTHGIELAGDSTYRRLPSGNVVAVTREKDIVVLAPETGKLLFRTSVAGTLNTGFVFGFTAFERSGRLLVAINDERAFGEAISAPARLGEPRCDFGRLYCLDLEHQTVAWSLRMEPSVFPVVHGVDVLAAWSLVSKEPGLERRTGNRHLRIHLINLENGRLVGSHEHLNVDIPVSVDVSQQSGELRIQALSSEIIAAPALPSPRPL